MWTLLLLVGMTIMGGFISYYGDLQGRRWGKKRRRLGGLRPKHTAILVTSVTGATIVLLSVLGVMLAAPNVRDVVLRGEAAIRDNKTLLHALELEKRSFDVQLQATRFELAEAQKRSATATAKYAQIRNQLTQKQSDLDALLARQGHLQAELQKGQANLTTLRRQSAALQQRNSKLLAQSRNLNRSIQKYDQQNSELARENLNLHRESISVQKQIETIKRESADLAKRIDALQADRKELERQKEVLDRSNKQQLEANREVERIARERASQLENEIGSLTRKQTQLLSYLEGAESAVAQYINLREKRISFQAGEQVAQRTLEARQPVTALRRELDALLREASAAALLRGAGKDANGLAIRLFNARATPFTSNPDAVQDQVIIELARSSGQVALMATTMANTLEGEPALVKLAVLPVRPTFKRGQMIATTTIDATQATEPMVNALVMFLQQDVRNAAIAAGTIPNVDRGSGITEVGVFGPADLVDLMDRVRKLGGDVDVTAIASRNLTSIDPLRLTFRVTRSRKRL